MRFNYNHTLITGLGIHSCLGADIPTFTDALRSGKCGLHHAPERLAFGYQSDLCGDVPRVADERLAELSRAQRQCLSQPAEYALSAVRQALADADVPESFLRTHNVSLIVSNDSTAEALTETHNIMQTRNDTRYLGAGAVFRSLNSTVSMNLASVLGIHGLSLTVSAACAGGGHALGLAKILLDNWQTEMVIVVGAQESNVSAMQSFDALGVFSQDKVRPFGKGRNGLAPSGGAACVILETVNTYYARSADVTPYARLSGYGSSSNGKAISTPDAFQEQIAMTKAVFDARLCANDIDAVLAHATGTPMGDAAEAEAISKTFPNDDGNVRVVATKGMTGHECWMAGVSQAVQASLMIRYGFLPGSVGAEDSDFPELDIVHRTVAQSDLQHILCNAFGFGGTNSSFIISNIVYGKS